MTPYAAYGFSLEAVSRTPTNAPTLTYREDPTNGGNKKHSYNETDPQNKRIPKWRKHTFPSNVIAKLDPNDQDSKHS